MEPIATQPRPAWRVALPWLLWSLLLAAWTAALLIQWESAHGVREVILTSKRFWANKILHVCAYAFFAFVVWWLPMRRNGRPWVWALLIAHGALTEYLQTFVERDGNVYDVALDAVSVLLGAGVGLVLWRQREAKSSSNGLPGDSTSQQRA